MVLARAIRVGNKGSVIAGVAMQAAELYDKAYSTWITMNVDRKHPYSNLGIMLRLKAMWRRAIAQQYQVRRCCARVWSN